jgi:uncharacterized protein (TIGR03435 family)
MGLGILFCLLAAASGIWAQQPLAFEVASIKLSKPGQSPFLIRPLPGGQSYVATNVPVKLIMKLMYHLTDGQVVGGPEWLDSDRYDIQAHAEHPSSVEQLHEMFRTLLTDRFQLQFHREMREQSAYVLSVDKSGAKLKVNDSPQNFDVPIRPTGVGKFAGIQVPMSYLAWYVAQILKRPVVDKTGLDKSYDFTLEWFPEVPPGTMINGAPAPESISIFTALHEQLGLKLTAEKAPVEVFVIDNAEKPSEN